MIYWQQLNYRGATLALLCFFLMAGCVSTSARHNTGSTPLPDDGNIASNNAVYLQKILLQQQAKKEPPPMQYHFHVGDIFDVKFFKNSELNENVIVRPDGKISLQLIFDELHVVGMTPAELREELILRYTGILRKPEVSIIVRKYSTQKIYVGGEVTVAGAINLDTPLTALQAIFQAGGFKYNAQQANVLVFRNTGDNKTSVISLDLESQLEGESEPYKLCDSDDCDDDENLTLAYSGDLPLKANDIIFVSKTRIGRIADFMYDNVGRIVPLYRNMGLNFNYELKRSTTIRTE